MDHRIVKRKQFVCILIPNATSPRNLGDLAMLESLVSLVKEHYPNASITIHSVEPRLYGKNKFKVRDTLYSWAVFSRLHSASRIVRLIQLGIAYFSIKYKLKPALSLINSRLAQLVHDYAEADIIFFVGGGYLRSKKGVTQSLNFIMQLVMFKFANLFHAKKYIAPVSFGPFAYKWQELFAAHCLRNSQLVTVREEYSLSILQKYHMDNLHLSFDHALLTERYKSKKNGRKKIVLGFTVREWLDKEKQRGFEDSLVSVLKKFSNVTGATIKPIIQVDAPLYGEDDKKVTKRIVARLKKYRVKLDKVAHEKSLTSIKKIYTNIDLLLGMRMHSNILAAVQHTPFVAISYEHKTEGISKLLKLDKYSIKCDEVDEEKLFALLMRAYKQRKILKNKLVNTIKRIQKNEQEKWSQFLSQ